MIALQRKPAIMKGDVGLELISLITLARAAAREESPGGMTWRAAGECAMSEGGVPVSQAHSYASARMQQESKLHIYAGSKR